MAVWSALVFFDLGAVPFGLGKVWGIEVAPDRLTETAASWFGTADQYTMSASVA